MLTLSIFAVLLVLIMVDLPIAVAIALTAISFFVGMGNESLLTMLPQRMYASTTGFVLLAVPFFILAGNLMNVGGVTTLIFRFAKAVIGHFPGGLGQVSIIANVIFSGMSGSALADAAGLGQVLHKAMVDNGFKPKHSAAIVATAATIGPVIPPSIPFVLYGALTGVSVGKLFLAGFIPGALMALAMMIAVGFNAKRYDLPKEKKADFREVAASFKAALLPLLTPVIVIGGIVIGLFTPTEAAVVASVYALFLGFLYKDLKVKDLPNVLWTSIRQTTSLLFIIAAAGFFGWFTIHQKVPDQIIYNLTSMSATPGGILAMVIVVVLLLGCYLHHHDPHFCPHRPEIRNRPGEFRRGHDPADHDRQPDTARWDVPLRGTEFQQGQPRGVVQRSVALSGRNLCCHSRYCLCPVHRHFSAQSVDGQVSVLQQGEKDGALEMA
jgi:C4-dicarboxylate transporter DctM subunit